jgi:hypothetical protein
MSDYDNGFRRAQAQYESKTPYDDEKDPDIASFYIEASVIDTVDNRQTLEALGAYDFAVIDGDEYRSVMSFSIGSENDFDDIEDITKEYIHAMNVLKRMGAYIERKKFIEAYMDKDDWYEDD